MKDRLATLAGALVSLYLVIALLAPPSTESPESTSRPTTQDRGRHGLHVLYHWLTASEIPVKSFRLRYDELALETGEGGGNLLVISLPQWFPAREREKDALLDWLTVGNHALVLAAVHDSPMWAGEASSRIINAFLSDLGVRFISSDRTRVAPAERRQRALRALIDEGDPTQKQTSLQPAGPLPVLQGVHAVDVRRDTTLPERYRLEASADDQLHLVLLKDRDTAEPHLWAIRIGEGRLWLSSYSGLFSNEGLVAPGNARLIGNLVSLARAPDGKVLFDDMHQGLSALYDPQAFFSDPRLHYSLLFMLAFWLLYIVGRSNRLGPVQARAEAPRAIAFVHAAGGFLARRLTRPAAARALLAGFYNELRAHHGMPLNGEPAWDLLSRVAQPGEIAALERWQRGVRRPDLVALSQLLTKLRRKLI